MRKYLFLIICFAFIACSPEQQEEFFNNDFKAECHAKYEQAATFDPDELPLPISQVTHTLKQLKGDCPFPLTQNFSELPLTVDMVNPFLFDIGGHMLQGTLTAIAPRIFTYEADGGPFELGNNCMAEMKTDGGVIEVGVDEITMTGELEIWFTWKNGFCSGLDVFSF